MRMLVLSACLTAALVRPADVAWSAAPAAPPVPRAADWLGAPAGELKSPAPPENAAAELDQLKAAIAKRTAGDVERIQWWAAGGPVYRWNEIAIDALLYWSVERQEAYVDAAASLDAERRSASAD